MSFPKKVEERALVACGRHCCICHQFCGPHIELHHIHQHADGGEDTFENCIPLCFNCHADMGKRDSHHPKGKGYSERELIAHRDNWYSMYQKGLAPSEVSQTKKQYNEIRKSVSEALTLYANRYHNPLDIADLPNHALPASYIEASDELRKLGAKIIAVSEVIENDFPISQEDLHTVGSNLIGLSNSMTTPYGCGIDANDLRNTIYMEQKIRTLLSLSQR